MQIHNERPEFVLNRIKFLEHHFASIVQNVMEENPENPVETIVFVLLTCTFDISDW